MKKIFLYFSFMLMSASIYAQNALLDSAQLAKKTTFKSIEEALKKPLEVYKLELIDKKMTEFPPQMLQFKNLQVLICHRAGLKSVFKEIQNFKNLQKLVIDTNPFLDIKDILLKIKPLKKLKTLSLGGNSLTSLPTEIGDITSLESLVLIGNKLQNLPASIGKLQNLKFLDIYNNEITAFPTEIKNLKKLESIDAGGNKIKDFDILIDLPKLKFVNYIYNPMEYTPDFAFFAWKNGFLEFEEEQRENILPILEKSKFFQQEIKKDSIKLAKLDETLLNLFQTYEKQKKELDDSTIILKHYQFKTYDLFVEANKNPKKVYALNINNQKNSDLQNLLGIEKMTNLRFLNIEQIGLNDLNQCKNLVNLRTLTGFGNGLFNLKGVKNFKYLYKLQFPDNQINEISEEIKELKNLIELNLDKNSIAKIPDEISELKNLKILSLGLNLLDEIPASIGKLENLEQLILSGNELKKLPEEITQLKKLKILSVKIQKNSASILFTPAQKNWIKNQKIEVD